jgi:hypothetical protein
MCIRDSTQSFAGETIIIERLVAQKWL